MSKTKNLTLASRIRQMKAGDAFEVIGRAAAQRASKVAKTLRDAEVISIQISTREIEPGKFKVFAL